MTNLPTDPKASTQWVRFLEWLAANYPTSTYTGGTYSRRAANGMDASEDMNYLPTEHNFWIWWVRYQATLPPQQQPRTETGGSDA